MYIIPKNSTLLGDELLCASGQQAASANDAYNNFLDAFNKVLEQAGVQIPSVNDGTQSQEGAFQASSALASQATIAAAAAAAGKQAEQTIRDVGDVQFTQQELGLLRRDLVKAGVPEDALAEYDKLRQQPDGATLSQVAASLKTNSTPPVLSDSDRAHLDSALKKIDSSGETAKAVYSRLEQGKFTDAWNTVSQAMQKNASERHTFDTNEISAFCKAFKLSSDTTASIMSSFGQNASLSLDAADFSRLMTPGQQELMNSAKAQQKINTALSATLQPRINVARMRMDDERNAGAKSNVKADQSLVHIEKTVTKKVRESLSEILDGEESGQAAVVGEKNNLKGEKGEHFKSDTVKNEQGKPEVVKGDSGKPEVVKGESGKLEVVKGESGKSEGSKNEQGKSDFTIDSLKSEIGRTARSDQESFSGRGGRDSSDSSRDSSGDEKAWDSILNKTEVRPSAQMAFGGINFNMPGSIATNATSAATNAASTAKELPQLSRQVAGQVEQAALSAMRDGSKRLDLQLSAGELGAVTVVLTSRNGEVSATIRSERAETTELMARQLETIRSNLEAQGVKVDKLEAQTQTTGNNNDQNWQGLDRHNMGQEENARREDLERLRNLVKARNSTFNSSGDVLEQAMQSSTHPAGISSRSINIVA